MKIESILEKLCALTCVPGDEIEETGLSPLVEPYGEIKKDALGNVILKRNVLDKPEFQVVLDAHFDEVGMIVTNITKDGFLKIAPCGGLDPKVIFGADVIVLGEKKYPGVVCTVPPHLQSEERGRWALPGVTDVYVDVGYSFEKVTELIPIGSKIILKSRFLKLAGNIYSGKAMDNRAGCAALIYALEKLRKKKLRKTEVNVIFSAMEEIGSKAYQCAVNSLNPTHVIVVDTTFGTSNGEDFRLFKLGEGPALGISPVLNHELKCELEKLAKKGKIPFQSEVMGGKTRTNADGFSASQKAMLVSIPIKYMHLPVGCVNLKDVEMTGQLIANFIESLEKT
ncbi:MAG: M42 family peptidase [Oscillospiraceae bacterium]|jgi:endoglucanase|nr:M42 family peptidase [Oscillospiraceae bacterium]